MRCEARVVKSREREKEKVRDGRQGEGEEMFL